MLPNRINKIALPVVICFIGLISSIAIAQPTRAPNIVLIVADDLGYGELGCQGNDEIPTPHIDSIADNGVRFTQGYVTASYCSSSRAGLLTGRYQSRFGYEFNPTGAHNEDPAAGLPVSESTLADVLAARGYTTGLFGKWHLGGTARFHPHRRGFDEFYGFLHEGHFFVPPPYHGTTTWLRRKALPPGTPGDLWKSADGKLFYSTQMGGMEPDYDADNPIYRGGQPVEEPRYLTDAIADEAVDFIKRHRDKPFFLYVPFNAVHSPLQAKDHDMEKFAHIQDPQRRIFAAMLGNLDDGVGRILDSLDQYNLSRDSIVFFISDNGGPTKELTSSNGPLRDGKGSVYEGGLRVPFLISWPGILPAAKDFDRPVSSLDIFATSVAIAGASTQPDRVYDGVNLIPYLTGQQQSAPHPTLFWRMGANRRALLDGDWKLVFNRRGRRGGPEADGWELYQLSYDLGEQNNLASSQPEKLAELKAVWETINAEMIDPVWSPSK